MSIYKERARKDGRSRRGKSSQQLSIEGSENVQVLEFLLVNTGNTPGKVVFKSWGEWYMFKF